MCFGGFEVRDYLQWLQIKISCKIHLLRPPDLKSELKCQQKQIPHYVGTEYMSGVAAEEMRSVATEEMSSVATEDMSSDATEEIDVC